MDLIEGMLRRMKVVPVVWSAAALYLYSFDSTSHSPIQLQSSVHGRSARLHWHLPDEHPFLHLQCFNSRSTFETSSIVVQRGENFPSVFFQPQNVGSGSACTFSQLCPQTYLKIHCFFNKGTKKIYQLHVANICSLHSALQMFCLFTKCQTKTDPDRYSLA